MNGMIGADPDALERLAGDFDRQATVLDGTVSRVRANVHASPWAGTRANRFRSDWDNRYGPQLRRTAAALRDAAKRLRSEAADQRRASSSAGVGGGSAGSRTGQHASSGSTAHGGSSFTPSIRVDGSTWLDVGLKASELYWRKIPLVGDVRKAWELNELFTHPATPESVIKGLDMLGGELGDVGGKTKNPVAMLGGMAIQMWAYAATEALKSDFSASGVAAVRDEIARNPGVLAEEFANATVQVGLKFFSSLPIIGGKK